MTRLRPSQLSQALPTEPGSGWDIYSFPTSVEVDLESCKVFLLLETAEMSRPVSVFRMFETVNRDIGEIHDKQMSLTMIIT